MLDVGGADAGDDPDVGTRQSGQRGDFPAVIHADFPDCGLVLLLGIKDREGKTDVVVEVPLGGRDAEHRAKHGGRHVLYGGFPAAAGHHDAAERELRTPGGRQKSHPRKGIGCGEDSEGGGESRRRLVVAESPDRTFGRGLG